MLINLIIIMLIILIIIICISIFITRFFLSLVLYSLRFNTISCNYQLFVVSLYLILSYILYSSSPPYFLIIYGFLYFSYLKRERERERERERLYFFLAKSSLLFITFDLFVVILWSYIVKTRNLSQRFLCILYFLEYS